MSKFPISVTFSISHAQDKYLEDVAMFNRSAHVRGLVEKDRLENTIESLPLSEEALEPIDSKPLKTQIHPNKLDTGHKSDV